MRFLARGVAITLACTALAVSAPVASAGARPAGSAQLVPVASVPGSIWDISPSAILWQQGDTIYRRDRGTGTDTTLFASVQSPVLAYLTPTGALLERTSDGGATYQLDQSFQGRVIGRGQVPLTRFRVSGDFAIWPSGTPGSATAVFSNTTTTILRSYATVVDPSGYDVSAKGVAVYSSPGGDLFRANRRQEEGVRAAGSAHFRMPLTDGTSIVYSRRTACCLGPQRGSILLRTGITDVPLTATLHHGPYPILDYQIDGGWVAYRSDDLGGLHLRAPDGSDTTVSTSHASLLAMNDAGQVIYGQGRKHDYITLPGADPIRLPSSYPLGAGELEHGRGASPFTVWIQGAWYVVDAGTIYHLVLTP